MKTFLDSDLLKAVQFFLNKVQKKPNKVQKYLTVIENRNCDFLKNLQTFPSLNFNPSFFDIAQSKGGRSPPPLHNFLSFNLNLMKLSAIDHWGMLYLLVVMYCT